jgi:hypothetical protein
MSELEKYSFGLITWLIQLGPIELKEYVESHTHPILQFVLTFALKQAKKRINLLDMHILNLRTINSEYDKIANMGAYRSNVIYINSIIHLYNNTISTFNMTSDEDFLAHFLEIVNYNHNIGFAGTDTRRISLITFKYPKSLYTNTIDQNISTVIKLLNDQEMQRNAYIQEYFDNVNDDIYIDILKTFYENLPEDIKKHRFTPTHYIKINKIE